MADLAGFRSGDTDDAAKAFRVIRGDVEGDAKDSAELVAKEVRKRAQRQTAPGTAPNSPAAITFDRNRMGGSVVLDHARAPWIVAQEYGAIRAWVFGHVTRQSRLSRRQFGTHVRDDMGGYLVGAAWKSIERDADRMVADEMDDAMGRDFDRHGIRKGIV